MCKKVLRPQDNIVPQPKSQKRPAPWNYNSLKFINTP